MKKLITIYLILLTIVGCAKTEQPKEVVEEVQEPTTYSVEFTDLQIELLDEINLAELEGLKNGNTYEIQLEDKDKILKSLDMWLDADCLEIWADNEDWVDNVYHSKDYQLFKIYLSDTSKNAQDTFSTLYAKRLFEFGLIYNKFDGKDSWIFITYYDKNGNKISQIDSDMLDL